MFREALKAVGAQPEQTLFIGDTPKADIVGANRQGMITVLKDPSGQRKGAEKADYRIKRIMDLPEVLKNYKLGGN